MFSVQADIMHCLSNKAITCRLPMHRVNSKQDTKGMIIIHCVLDVTFSSLKGRKLFEKYLVEILLSSVSTQLNRNHKSTIYCFHRSYEYTITTPETSLICT